MTVRRSEWELEDLADVQWREDWCAWLERYGIDPNLVCFPGWVEADDDTRQIRFLAYVFDDEGRLILDHSECEDDGHGGHVRRCRGAREVRVLQLEAPALPFPEAS